MKNFKGIKNFLNKTYDSALELAALTLANTLNKGLRKIIIRQGKDPDYVKPSTAVRGAFEGYDWGLPAGFVDRSPNRPTFNFINKKRDFPTTSQKSIDELIDKVEKHNTEQAVNLAPTIVEEVQVVAVETTPEVQVGFDIGNAVPNKPKKRAPRKRATKKATK